MIDTVGYMVDGAVGADEDGVPRMVATPWYDYEIPMTEAAELGTKKVMQEHCSIGMIVTTDGTITDIPREDYIAAEKRAIEDMKATGKPFMVIINSRYPHGEAAKALKAQLLDRYGIEALTADCQAIDLEDIQQLFKQLLLSFHMSQLHVHLPRWLDALENGHPVKKALYNALLESAENILTLAQADTSLSRLKELEQVMHFAIRQVDLGTGTVSCEIGLPEKLFYEILSSKAGVAIESDAQLLQLLAELSAIRQEYDKISDALSAVKATGYGIVMPTAAEMTLETPELLKKNGSFGVKLRAGAPSIHMMRVDIDTEINPIVGDEKQSQELVEYLCGESPEKLWESNIFGKSVYTMIQDGLTAKLVQTPEDVRMKFRGTLTKIVNEGATGLICLIL
jgi:stage IV sporulation protein A